MEKRLKALRIDCGLTQQEVSERLGIDRVSYARFEIGKRVPTTDKLEMLADFYCVSTDYLLGRTDIPNIYETLAEMHIVPDTDGVTIKERTDWTMNEQKNITCPHCSCPDCEEDHTYCFNCGKPLKNFCTNDACIASASNDSSLQPIDVFCPWCGEPSTFHEAGLIAPRSFDD